MDTQDLLQKNYNIILTIFIQIQSESSLYPELDFESCWEFFKKIQQDSKFSQEEEEGPEDNQEANDDADSTGDEKI